MASIFTYQDEPPRIHSPWSTPGTATPQPLQNVGTPVQERLQDTQGLKKLEPERQDGPTEYKLHLLLRPRRKFVSSSTASSSSGLYYFNSQPAAPTSRSLEVPAVDRPSGQPSGQARQMRLQQLTTQLLWRLQQSSPFHSSSNAELVLPVLPEATPRLGVPDRPAKLLPGLEESQGALYEIGVADDGTLVGLVEEELQESLNNLRAMAASLGCTTNMLRKVAVGNCEWVNADSDSGQGQLEKDTLWVAEVLVYPDSRGSVDEDVPKQILDPPYGITEAQEDSLTEQASNEQLRVTLVGATSAGKSSLLGTLSTSTLDNGRGKSRLSLLKHRHEIASGITSSVAQELVGYRANRELSAPVINYASGNVSSWVDIHNLADRLVFLSDSPGLPRFAKSCFRSLISWRPSWTILCVAADDNMEDIGRTPTLTSGTSVVGFTSEATSLSLSHLDLCLRLELPLMIVITKLDLANKTGLRLVLGKLLTALKAAHRSPVMLSNTPGPSTTSEADGSVAELQSIMAKDQVEIDRLISSIQDGESSKRIPILMTSAVTGQGISKLHALLRSLPESSSRQTTPSPSHGSPTPSAIFHVDEVFSIPPSRVYSSEAETRPDKQGIVLCGYISRGTLSIGDVLFLGPFAQDLDLPSSHRSQPMLRSKSYCAGQSPSEKTAGIVARSYQGESLRAAAFKAQTIPIFLHIRVVSLRNLRLPVTHLRQGETGTIGVELIRVGMGNEPFGLERARKGMVLMQSKGAPTGYHSFSATFPASDFGQANSPPLILGGHAILYVNSLRAAIKVTAVALDDEAQGKERSSSLDAEIFSFDSDGETGNVGESDSDAKSAKEITIKFRFVSSVEWISMGDQVLVVPTVTAPGPVTGPAVSNTSVLAGFVGRVSDLVD
ncbi:elongation factor EF-1 alpha subunit [Exophiala viscosa]|uniref:Elongation factor EF-1 alpha subunit n=1 Tax=Exophiala viscosa TaxID=2486360 RepID=A0AAN6DT15_9EURO|nr:elongation factor EF-1 alpha subunit [Exophiala viscosa]